jgi:hypothetical protein
MINYENNQICKLSTSVIENFEKNFKENVIQPITTLNDYGEIISYVYSNQSTFVENNNKKRVVCYSNLWTARYGMVYFQGNCFRYDYVYDETILFQSFTHVHNNFVEKCKKSCENNNCDCIINKTYDKLLSKNINTSL